MITPGLEIGHIRKRCESALTDDNHKETEMLDLKALFDKYDDEHSRFERVENKASGRPDLCAFLALDRLAPGGDRDIIAAAEHDEIWLDVDLEKLAASATEDDILMLARCGVRFDDMNESLAMFV